MNIIVFHIPASGLFWGFAFTPRLQKRRDACFFTAGCVISPFSQRDRFVAGLSNGRSGRGYDPWHHTITSTSIRTPLYAERSDVEMGGG